MRLRDLAHARTGDKGDISSISVIAYDPGDFAFLAEHVTAEGNVEFMSQLMASTTCAACPTISPPE